MRIAITIIQLLCSIVLVLTILFQSGSKQGLGSIGGAAESFLSKSKTGDFDAKMKKLTIVAGVVFVIATIGLNILSAF